MLNKTKETMRSKSHENFMGGPSYDLSPFARLFVMAVSSFFGEDGYYPGTRRHSTKHVSYLSSVLGTFGAELEELMTYDDRGQAMHKAIVDSMAYDAGLTLNFLAWLRTKALIRATPAAGLAIASHCPEIRGTGMLNSVSDKVLSRLDDVTNCLAYCLDIFGKPIPNSLKKVLAKRLEKASEYELAKYAGKNKKVSLKSVIRLTHPHSEAIDKFCRDEISQATDGQETWEAILSAEGASKESWEKAIPVMGHMALLRNLRNFEKHGVDESLYVDKLLAGVENGKQLPFRYYSAWQNVTSSSLRKVLEQCMDKSIINLPHFDGKSLILVDNSGSATGTYVSKLSNVSVSTAGNLMGILTGLVSEEGRIGVFGDKIKYETKKKNFKGTTLEMLRMVNDIGDTVGSATENGIWLALDDAIREKQHYDRIFIYSDMQAGHGGLYGTDAERKKYPKYPDGQGYYIDVPKLVAEYRQKVNPHCKLYSIQIAGYSDNIFPEFYPDTCIMGGWSTEILKFVELFEKDPMKIEDMFRKEFAKQ